MFIWLIFFHSCSAASSHTDINFSEAKLSDNDDDHRRQAALRSAYTHTYY